MLPFPSAFIKGTHMTPWVESAAQCLYCILTWDPPRRPSPRRPRAAWPRPRCTPASEWALGIWKVHWGTACSPSGSLSGSWHAEIHNKTYKPKFRIPAHTETNASQMCLWVLTRPHTSHAVGKHFALLFRNHISAFTCFLTTHKSSTWETLL